MMYFRGKCADLGSLMPPLILGIVAFFVIVGPNVLWPTNIAWLSSGDPTTHYLGWEFFRNSPWEFPVGLNPSYGLELSSSILYSDSLPLFSIALKPFASLLPSVFQYFGFWLLCCFILQAWFGWLLVGLATESARLRFLGAGLIVFSPPMITRMGEHLSLAGHFIVLAALYLTFNRCLQRRGIAWGILISCAAFIHAYFLAMVLLIWFADLFDRRLARSIYTSTAMRELVSMFLLVIFVCWQIGYFSVDGGVSSGGYGLYRMNVLSMFDSGGWSYILKDLPERQGDYEGFNYLGAGALLLLAISSLGAVFGRAHISWWSSRHWCLVILFISLFVFSISNRISFGGLQFEYPIPDSFNRVASVFRASGRFFWPVFYGIIVASIFLVLKVFNRRSASIVLGLALFVQIFDTSAGWLPLRKHFLVEPEDKWNSPLVSPFWDDAAKRFKRIRYIPAKNSPEGWKFFAYFASRHGLSTDGVYLARVSDRALENAKDENLKVLRSGLFDIDTLYIVNDAVLKVASVGKRNSDFLGHIDGFNVIAPEWNNCKDCFHPTPQSSSVEVDVPVNMREPLSFDVAGNGVKYLAWGWSSPEGWGTWSDGSSSAIVIPWDSKNLDYIIINANVLVNSTHPTQRVDILINGISIESEVLQQTTASLRLKVPDSVKNIADSGIRIDFSFPNAARPMDIGLGSDGRNLAFGVKSIVFE